jgi:hypothetical protein
MPAWVTVYVQEVPQALTSEQLKNGISPADWWTLGETFGIEADAVTEFMKSLQWKDQPLSFGQVDQRPVRCYAWTTPERVREEIAELRSPPTSVRHHLAQVQAVVALEMGFSQLETMYEIVAFEIAYWLAETYRGLICGPNDRWYDHADHRWDPIER